MGHGFIKRPLPSAAGAGLERLVEAAGVINESCRFAGRGKVAGHLVRAGAAAGGRRE